MMSRRALSSLILLTLLGCEPEPASSPTRPTAIAPGAGRAPGPPPELEPPEPVSVEIESPDETSEPAEPEPPEPEPPERVRERADELARRCPALLSEALLEIEEHEKAVCRRRNREAARDPEYGPEYEHEYEYEHECLINAAIDGSVDACEGRSIHQRIPRACEREFIRDHMGMPEDGTHTWAHRRIAPLTHVMRDAGGLVLRFDYVAGDCRSYDMTGQGVLRPARAFERRAAPERWHVTRDGHVYYRSGEITLELSNANWPMESPEGWPYGFTHQVDTDRFVRALEACTGAPATE